MKIAILGWGSLIWSPQTLNYNTTLGWQTNGPILPIEFARISKDGRLTLVITEEGTKVNTLYAISSYQTINEAVLNLQKREGTIKKRIGVYNKTTNIFSPDNFKFKEAIKQWISKEDIDAVIWTNLPEKWSIEKQDNLLIDSNKRVKYLQELSVNKRAKAEEYIRKTPTQIKTKYRAIIEEKLNWKPINL